MVKAMGGAKRILRDLVLILVAIGFGVVWDLIRAMILRMMAAMAGMPPMIKAPKMTNA